MDAGHAESQPDAVQRSDDTTAPLLTNGQADEQQSV